ncbi:MAG: serine--tRNA ligase [Sedimentisphaerales bacterium]|nr:serine--tRNA ligase [Sedimentisphaerales bacterium]
MIDIKDLRANTERYKTACEQKRSSVDIDALLSLDEQARDLRQELQDLTTEKNQAGKTIAQIKDADERQRAIDRMSELKAREKEIAAQLEALEPQIEEMMLLVPLPSHPESPVGPDESGNVEVRRWGEVRDFGFEAKDHIELGTALGIVDLERGVKLSGSRNYVLRGDGALLHRAVLSLALDLMVEKGFEPMTVPVLTKEKTFMGTGWFPEGKAQAYQVPEDELFLVGTAEVPVTSFHMDEILDESELPKRYVAQSLCFRREAGAAGKDTYGLYRIHQFEKVEQVIVCKYDLEEAEKWHQCILANSEELMQKLELPYRVLEICTGDMGTGKYRMYDIETYMPSRGGYCETHSASNLLDFQTRRLNLRYRDADRKVRHCISMNNTVVASPRVLIPLLELNQNADGSITIPVALRPYMGGRERIVAK